MATKDFARDLKATLVDLKAKGMASIDSDNMICYLDDVIANPQQDEYDQYRQDLARHTEMKHASDLKMFESVIQFGLGAIKSSMLLNGGAAVAMLAFVSNLANTDVARASHYASTIVRFAFGALMATMLG